MTLLTSNSTTSTMVSEHIGDKIVLYDIAHRLYEPLNHCLSQRYLLEITVLRELLDIFLQHLIYQHILCL